MESAVFGSEFVAARIGVDLVDGLRYKCRMMGIPVEGKVNMFIDNGSVVTNSTLPESQCKKKHNAIAYHRIREAIAGGWLQVCHIAGTNNLADFLTKCTPAPTLHFLVGHIFWKKPK